MREWRFSTGGETVALRCSSGDVAALVEEALVGTTPSAAPPSIEVVVEASRRPFDVCGWSQLTRDAWEHAGSLVVHDVCTSGYDLLVTVDDGTPRLRFRHRPPATGRAAGVLLRTRARLLARAVLLQSPALWWAQTRGRAPIHAPAVEAGGAVALLAGPGGLGKSTLVDREVTAGGRAVADNLCVSDGHSTWGVVEPMRLHGGRGRRAPHGRREVPLAARVEVLQPDRVVVLRRGIPGSVASVRRVEPTAAARALVAGTYMCGELRRHWGLAAVLSLGTGHGTPHPPVEAVALELARRLPCVEVTLPTLEGVRLADVLAVEPAGACA